MEKLRIVANCDAAAVREIASLAHETRAIVELEESGAGVWACVEISPTTDTRRAVFPVDLHGVRGDARRQGQAGVLLGAGVGADKHALSVVIARASRMYRAGIASAAGRR